MASPASLVSTRTAVLALVLMNVLWGSSFPVIKTLNVLVDQHFGVDEATASSMLRAASAAWMISLRFALALVLFLVFFRSVLPRVGRPHLIAGATIGFFFAAGMVLQVAGLSTIPASRSGFLTSLAVVWTPVITTVIQRRRPRSTVLLAVAVSLLGVAVLTGWLQWSDGGLQLADGGAGKWKTGDTLTMLAVLFFSAQIVVVDTFGKTLDSLAFTPSMFATTAILSGLFFGLAQPWIPELHTNGDGVAATWMTLLSQPRFYVLVGLLAVFPSLLAFSLMNRFQPSVSPTQAAVIYTLEPLMASGWAMWTPAILAVACGIDYANETLTWELVTGGAILIGASMLAMWPEQK